jgi:hypothetical protein
MLGYVFLAGSIFVHELRSNDTTDDIDVLGKYHEHSDYIIGKDLSNKNRLKEDILR